MTTWLDTKGYAARLGCSDSYVRRLGREGRLVRVGRRINAEASDQLREATRQRYRMPAAPPLPARPQVAATLGLAELAAIGIDAAAQLLAEGVAPDIERAALGAQIALSLVAERVGVDDMTLCFAVNAGEPDFVAAVEARSAVLRAELEAAET